MPFAAMADRTRKRGPPKVQFSNPQRSLTGYRLEEIETLWERLPWPPPIPHGHGRHSVRPKPHRGQGSRLQELTGPVRPKGHPSPCDRRRTGASRGAARSVATRFLQPHGAPDLPPCLNRCPNLPVSEIRASLLRPFSIFDVLSRVFSA